MKRYMVVYSSGLGHTVGSFFDDHDNALSFAAECRDNWHDRVQVYRWNDERGYYTLLVEGSSLEMLDL